MGLCASSSATRDENAPSAVTQPAPKDQANSKDQQQQQQQPNGDQKVNHDEVKISVNSSYQSPTSQSSNSTDIDAAYIEWRETLRNVTILVLDRLLLALEYEKEGYSEIALKRGLKSYTDLAATKKIEEALNAILVIKDVARPEVDESHMDYEYQRMNLFLKAAQQATFKDDNMSRDLIAKRVQDCSKAVQNELLESVRYADSSDLKIHLSFFGYSLDVLAGDIANPTVLYQNIDRIAIQDSNDTT